MKRLIHFLKALEALEPPPVGCHHVLMYAQFGSDEAGWSDRLMLQVNSDGVFYPFFLDDEDFLKTDGELVDEISTLLHSSKPANWQLSHVAGSAGPNPLKDAE